MMATATILFWLLVHSNAFIFPYDTKIKEWNFLHQEPAITLSDIIAKEPTDTYDIVYDLMSRVLGGTSLLSQFKLELIMSNTTASNQHLPIYKPKSTSNHPFWSKTKSSYLDIIELDNNGSNIILRGTSIIALTNAFNWYLEDFANTTYDWRTYTVNMPTSPLPLPPYTQKIRSVPFMYYQNVCTVSYTFAFWDWNTWQQHLDWMAMQGINMPLSFNGQEYIWAKTFAQFGFNTTDLSSFFSGPGFYAWNRMGNIQGWGGPLRESEIINQYNLQLQILARMNTFEMIPAMTCFAGHVPQAITTLYPNANVTKSRDWNGFPEPYCCVDLLDVSDPLFAEIGNTFIKMQTKYFGTSHIYQCDTFNEMDPPTNNPTYLKSATAKVYNAMNSYDENAIWLLQGWLFVSDGFWNNVTVSAYLSGVNDDAMIILDLVSEHDPIYNKYESYYGKPFVWNTLHDYGGHDGIEGDIPAITNGVVDALNFPNTTIMGVGTTMEGIWQNYIVYDATYKMGYKTKPINVTAFGERYAFRRYGLPHTCNNNMNVTNALVNSWILLANTLYSTSSDPHFNIQYTPITKVPYFNYSFVGPLPYNPMIVQKVWKQFVGIGNELQHVEKFRYDLIDVTRQIMMDLYNLVWHNFTAAHAQHDIENTQKYANSMIDIISDMDRIVLTNKHWMLGTWIEMARNQTNITNDNNDTKNWYEFNARNQITTWGPNGEVNNYACKQWGELVGSYYKPQWQSFVDQVIECMKNGSSWNQNAFAQSNYLNLEKPFSYSVGGYIIDPVNDTIIVACDLYKKWNWNGDTTCNWPNS
eukprot:320337_1